MTVTVRTCPVTVSSEVTGVGIHVDVDDKVVVCTEEVDCVVIGLVEEEVVDLVD